MGLRLRSATSLSDYRGDLAPTRAVPRVASRPFGLGILHRSFHEDDTLFRAGFVVLGLPWSVAVTPEWSLVHVARKRHAKAWKSFPPRLTCTTPRWRRPPQTFAIPERKRPGWCEYKTGLLHFLVSLDSVVGTVDVVSRAHCASIRYISYQDVPGVWIGGHLLGTGSHATSNPFPVHDGE